MNDHIMSGNYNVKKKLTEGRRLYTTIQGTSTSNRANKDNEKKGNHEIVDRIRYF